MKIYTEGKTIELDTSKKTFGEGSEGYIYKKNNRIYKIYKPGLLNEGHGNKKGHHEYLMQFDTEQIILPDDSIFNEDGNYIGYTTKFVNGKKNDKSGITLLDKKTLISNLQILEKDIRKLSEGYVLMADVTPFNTLIDRNEQRINIIDPGRYHAFYYDDASKCYKVNETQLKTLISLLIQGDIFKYKPVETKRKQILLKDKIKQDLLQSDYSLDEYFDKVLEDNSTILDYASSQKKYIR